VTLRDRRGIPAAPRVNHATRSTFPGVAQSRTLDGAPLTDCDKACTLDSGESPKTNFCSVLKVAPRHAEGTPSA
jgi:hypothetical protein